MPAGRPTDYRVEFCQIAFDMCQNGATDREVAEALDIEERTLYRWKNEKPEFNQALRVGKESSDDRVEMSLYRRATGYNFNTIKIMQYEGEVIVEPYVEHVPPDVGAAKLWLQNRRGWSEKSRSELTGADGGAIKTESTVTLTPDEAYKRMLDFKPGDQTQ
jgi:Asp-tRNA(Asn)/Glu-tRNA(Gln) amidotransferase A subunit family amidase